jgi:hypothetical protein
MKKAVRNRLWLGLIAVTLFAGLAVPPQGAVTASNTKVWAEVTSNGHTKIGTANVTVDDGSITFYPTDDAHVRDGVYANDNYGNYQQLETKNDNTTDFTRQAFMKFRLDGLDGPIASAKLLVNAAVTESGHTEATLGVYAAEGEWTENTLTYKNRPQLGALLNSAVVTNQFQWHEIDITSYVQERLADDGIVNLSLHQRRDADGTGKMIKINSIQHSDKPSLRILPAVPQAADPANNQVDAVPAAVALGSSVTLTAIGDRQAETGAVPGDERYLPIGWTSTEPDQSGTFTNRGGRSESVYTPSAAGTHQVTVDFALQRWDGTDWGDVPDAGDAKTVTVTVYAPGEGAALLSVNESERYPGQPFELTVSVTDVTYRFTTLDAIVHFDPNVLEFDMAEEDGVTVLSESALESLNEHFAVSSAVRLDRGEIRVIAFTAGNDHAIADAAPIFKLRGAVKDDADPAGTTTVSLSDVEVSFGELGFSLQSDHASAEIRIVEPPVEVDKSELSAAIADAETLLANAAVGSEPGQYPASAKAALAQAIEDAKAVRDRPDADQETVDQAAAALKAAVRVFLNAVHVPSPADVTALRAAIRQAQTMHDQAVTGEKIGQYPAAAKSALSAAIQAARTVRDSGTTSQSDVDDALQALASALERFSREIITLNPGASRVTIRDLAILAQYFGITSADPNWSKVAAADLNDTGVISIETLARVARMILVEWSEAQ